MRKLVMQKEGELAVLPALPQREFQAWVEANLLVEADLMEPGAVVDARIVRRAVLRAATRVQPPRGVIPRVFFTRISFSRLQ
jgi:hypothetical protein